MAERIEEEAATCRRQGWRRVLPGARLGGAVGGQKGGERVVC